MQFAVCRIQDGQRKTMRFSESFAQQKTRAEPSRTHTQGGQLLVPAHTQRHLKRLTGCTTMQCCNSRATVCRSGPSALGHTVCCQLLQERVRHSLWRRPAHITVWLAPTATTPCPVKRDWPDTHKYKLRCTSQHHAAPSCMTRRSAEGAVCGRHPNHAWPPPSGFETEHCRYTHRHLRRLATHPCRQPPTPAALHTAANPARPRAVPPVR